jgi:hypothetical protein
MTVRFASFNVENLFARQRAFNQATWAAGQPILDAYAEFNSLIALATYTPADKARMIQLLVPGRVPGTRGGRATEPDADPSMGVAPSQPRIVRRRTRRDGNRDRRRRPRRFDRLGRTRHRAGDEISTRMTARVIRDVSADVLGVVEAEDRPSLDRFNDELLTDRYGHVMLIDGNDTRGIDVGIMTTTQVEIIAMRSNVDVPDPTSAGEHLFSRDCAEYLCLLPTGVGVWVLLNHFKSQSGGGGAKRSRQAQGGPRHRGPADRQR